MTNLKQLLTEKCPKGIEYVKLGEVCTITKGKTPIQKAIPGEYPLVVTTSERKSCNTYQFDNAAVCIPLVSSRGHGVASLNHVYFQSGKFALGNILCAVIPNDENILSANFLFHYLEYKKDTLLVPLMKGGANVSLHIDDIQRVKIPLPPVEIQSKIIEILDKFVELSEVLSKELTARKKQYEYYKYCLFQSCSVFNSVNTTLITTDRFWLMPATPNYIEKGVPYITSKNVRNGKIDFSNVQYISSDDYEEISKNRKIIKNDLLITMIGTIGETAFVEDYTDFYGQNIYLIRIDESICLRKYFYYFLSQETVKKGLISRKNASSQGYIKAGSIENLSFPLPPIKEQERIVSILDRFDKLCNDISEGLPAEIEARRKQYEYYRDKLLSF